MDWNLMINVFAWSVFGGILASEIDLRSWKFWTILVLVFVVHITAAIMGSK